MAQQWKHGWIPLTPAAVRQKNHGRTPGPGNTLSKSSARDRSSSQLMDGEIRRAARSRDKTVQPGRPSPSEDVSEATKAIRAGDHVKAVNLLTRAMNNADSKEQKAAIKKQRDELTRKLMGRR